MDDFLKKELEKNQKYNDLIYKQLDIDKKKFIKEIKSELGKKIVVGFREEKVKISFWERIKRVFR